MRILHTADWHLGDRLGRIDRTEDLRRGVERVASYCQQHAVDVLVVAGDLFSELARPDVLRDAIGHLQTTFAEFLGRGGTILTITGNHDNENFCQTLCHAMNLAAPASPTAGSSMRTGRLYLAAEPTYLRLSDSQGLEVQFVLMPYPTAQRYLKDEASQKYTSLEERNHNLVTAFRQQLAEFRRQASFSRHVPVVLVAHITVNGSQLGGLFRINEDQDIVVETTDLASDFAYVALGHIHKPQSLGGQSHIRYSGSLDRLDLGERDDAKSVCLFELTATGLGPITLLPLPATPIYEVRIDNPKIDIPRLRESAEETVNDLVNLHLSYSAGDSLEQILKDLDTIYPRWYARDWREVSELGPSLSLEPPKHQGFEDTVREYLATELVNHKEQERADILARVEQLLQQLSGR